MTEIQRRVVRRLAANRSEASYIAGGAVLNKDWPRRSDDLDIFHDTDAAIGPFADRDLESLRAAGFRVRVDIDAYGFVEATVRDRGAETQIQWMSETRLRFFPLVRDEEWGARLAPADLAVNKVVASSTRRQARDAVDLALIGERLCPLGPLVMAAAGKPPHFSPGRTIEAIRRNCLSISNEEFKSVNGLPDEWFPAEIRDRIIALADRAEAYILAAPPSVVGRLALSGSGVPIEISNLADDDFELRAPTEEPDAMPEIKDVVSF